MKRIAEKVLPLMTPEEVRQIILDHYRSESQNLTTAAEANLLKFYEMEGLLNEAQAARWEAIKKEFNKRKLMGAGGDSDPVGRVVAQLTQFNDGLEAIKDGISQAGKNYSQPQSLAEQTVLQLRQIIEGLRAVPVQVDIKVVPVQDDKGSIEKMDAPDKPPLEFKPEVNQG